MDERVDGVHRWSARPLQAWCIRATAYVVPLVGSFLFVRVATSVVRPPMSSVWAFLGWWFGVSVAATVVLLGVYRLTRRLLPLAALLRLSLVFPDETPSRFRTAMRSGSVDTLERRLALVREARDAGTPREAATLLLELVAALDAHDRLTRGHSERVRAYSVLIGKELGLGPHDLELLNWAALLHDIGKLEVSPSILTKPDKPSDEEWQQLREHPLFGELITAPLAAWLEEWQSAVGYHHERWDGKGYPRGLAGNEIPLPGRIVAVADVFDVITSARSYKSAGSGVDGRREIARCAGSQFDPRVVRAFLNVSLGRMRLVMGPLSWLSHAPLLARVPLTPAVGALGGAAGILATAAASGALAHPAPVTPRVAATPIVVAAAPRAHLSGTSQHSGRLARATVALPALLHHRPSGVARTVARHARLHRDVPGTSSTVGASPATAPTSGSSPGTSGPSSATHEHSPPSSGSSPGQPPSKGSAASGATTSSGAPTSSGSPTSSSGTPASGGGGSGGGSSGGATTPSGTQPPSSGGSAPPAAALLALTAQPAQNANVQAGAQITVKVAVEDSSHHVVSGDSTTRITLALASNPGGATLSCAGGDPVTVASGVASLSCSLDSPGSGYTLTASSNAGLGTATSNSFNVTAGAPAKLVFTGQPSSTLSGSAVSPAVTVAVEDSFGNVVTADGSTSVTLALGANPGGGSLAGALTQTVSAGVASFANLHIATVASGYTLAASSSGLTGATSSAFTITAPAALGATLLSTNSASPCTSGSSCTTASVTPAPGATLLVLLERGGSTSTSDGVTSISGPLTGASQVTSVEYASATSRNYLIAWRATATSASGPITVAFKSGTNANPTTVEVVQLAGNNTTTPVAQAPTASGTSLLLGGASANLASPSASNGELVFVSFLANQTVTTPSGFTKLDAVATGSDGGIDLGLYYTGTPKASTTISAPGLGLLTGWGSLALEINHA